MRVRGPRVQKQDGGYFVIDTYSGDDSERVVDYLKFKKIKFEKTGSKIAIKIEPGSLRAAIVLSQLQKIAKFD